MAARGFDPFSTPLLGLGEGDFLSVMDGVDVLMALQRRHKLTEAAMRDIFDAVKALTVGCNLCSYDDALKFTKQYGITQAATSIDACVNDVACSGAISRTARSVHIAMSPDLMQTIHRVRCSGTSDSRRHCGSSIWMRPLRARFVCKET